MTPEETANKALKCKTWLYFNGFLTDSMDNKIKERIEKFATKAGLESHSIFDRVRGDG